MKKLWILLLFPLYLGGAELEERVDFLEKQMGEVSTGTANQTFGANFAPGNFQKGWIGLFATGDALYWSSKVGGTEYAYDLLGSAIGFNDSRSGESEEQDFKWGWGARGSLGLVFPSLGREIICSGTWFSTHQTDHHTQSLPSVLINLKGAFYSPSNHVSSRYDLSYNDVYFEIKKPFFLSSFLSTYTAIGAKRDWVDQDQHLDYTLQEGQTYHVKDTCHFMGTGLRIGIGTTWHLFAGINFTVDLGGAVLYGEFDVRHKEKLTAIREIDLKASSHLFSPEADFRIGLGWDLYASSYHLGISVSYEALYIWRQNKALEMEDTTPSSAGGTKGRFQVVRYPEDMTFYGATIRAKLEF